MKRTSEQAVFPQIERPSTNDGKIESVLSRISYRAGRLPEPESKQGVFHAGQIHNKSRHPQTISDVKLFI